jgi:hypothetical protein
LPQRAALARALFGERRGAGSRPAEGDGGERALAPLATEVADAAWDDLWSRLLGAPPGAGGDAALWRALSPWSGALELALPWPGGTLALLAVAEVVEALTGPAAPARSAAPRLPRPASPWKALAARTVLLEVQTEPFELDLGTLAALRVGDVIQTTHALDSPLAVAMHGPEIPSPVPVCAGFLGRAGDRRAVDLRRAPSAEGGARNPAPNP